MNKNRRANEEFLPEKTLGFWTIWALGVGSVIGDGIFLAMGQGIAAAGSSAIAAYLIAGLSQLFLMIALGELAVGMPNAGAMSLWVERFMGNWWGFLSGFTFAIGWVIAGGSTGLALGKITAWFFPQLKGDLWPILFSIIFLTLFAVLNLIGTSIAARTQLYLVIVLTVIMALFSIIGLKDIRMSHFSHVMPHGLGGFWAAIPMGTYAYLGTITLTTSGGECKNPKDLPRALIWSSITFLILYTLAQVVLQGIIPWNEFTTNNSPFTQAAGQVFGFAGAFIMNLAAWIAAATCVLMGTLYAAPRIFYAQAKEGYLPKFFSQLHPKTKTPVYGTIIVWIVSVIFIIISALAPSSIYVELSLQVTLAWMVSWTLALIAAIFYRQKSKKEVNNLPWKQPLYPLFPILGFLGILIVCIGTFVGSPTSLIIGAVWIGILFILFKVFYRSKKSIQSIKRSNQKMIDS
ncbi:APC family permease [Scopulibacillus cellulosilyticus]|uniref:APC family permease n=1 Tax=Scopulibacillus cellulosilyticus TaxID=2665665 RepID=A0ABW2PW20_9BACL